MSFSPRTRAGRSKSRHAAVGLFTLAVALGAWGPGPDAAQGVDRLATEANITRVVTAVLAESQLARHPLDEQLAGKLLDRYLEALDAERVLFLQSDVDGFAASYRSKLSEAAVVGDTRPAHSIFQRYLERLREQVSYATQLLRDEKFEFTGQDTYAFDRERAARPATLEDARKLWRQTVRAEYLQEKLSDKNPAPAEIVKTLTRRYNQRQRTMGGIGRDEVLAIYLDSLAHVYDPHSDYLGKEEMQSLSIQMNLSLFGIGAVLTSEDGVCTIRELVPGGPAEKSNELKPGDRIIAVTQAKGEPVDVSDMPLSKIVDMIRGPKGTTVTLTVLPPAGQSGPPRTVNIVRAQVKLEDQQAKARIIDAPGTGGGTVRLGVIDLPSFYSGEAGGHGATYDVAKLLGKLKEQNVAGVILDLRRNGGGSLEEAIKLTGLFIKRGPIVQTRDARNEVNVAMDPDPAVVYDGPLMVLASRFSASASEIAAGALQDYGRAIIVGDTTTFGKGTVQSVLPLAPMMDRARVGHAYEPGALKVTTGKFYRPSGGSTELKGVASDIVVPSRSEVAPVGESKLKDPLPWDKIDPAPFEKQNRVAPYLGSLRAMSTSRIGTAKGFSELRAENAAVKDRLAAGKISLNEELRRRELATTKARDEVIERQAKAVAAARKSYLITVKDAAQAGLPAPEAADGSLKKKPGDLTAAAPDDAEGRAREKAGASIDELVLDESLMIMRDYSRALSRLVD